MVAPLVLNSLSNNFIIRFSNSMSPCSSPRSFSCALPESAMIASCFVDNGLFGTRTARPGTIAIASSYAGQRVGCLVVSATCGCAIIGYSIASIVKSWSTCDEEASPVCVRGTHRLRKFTPLQEFGNGKITLNVRYCMDNRLSETSY
jgi:hypothetical protein